MNFKNQALKYIEKELIPSYKNFTHKTSRDTCGLCILFCQEYHCSSKIESNIHLICNGCPCNNIRKTEEDLHESVTSDFLPLFIHPCTSMKTFPNFKDHRNKEPFYLRRLNFWIKALPILHKIPKSAFNPETFQSGDYDEIHELDFEVATSTYWKKCFK